MDITQKEIDNWFMYHAPTKEQLANFDNLRAAAKNFAEVVLSNTPTGADQNTAIRKIREVVMTANAAVACKEQ